MHQKALDPVRSPKLSWWQPSQYYGWWQRGNTGCCNATFFFLFFLFHYISKLNFIPEPLHHCSCPPICHCLETPKDIFVIHVLFKGARVMFLKKSQSQNAEPPQVHLQDSTVNVDKARAGRTLNRFLRNPYRFTALTEPLKAKNPFFVEPLQISQNQIFNFYKSKCRTPTDKCGKIVWKSWSQIAEPLKVLYLRRWCSLRTNLWSKGLISADRSNKDYSTAYNTPFLI